MGRMRVVLRSLLVRPGIAAAGVLLALSASSCVFIEHPSSLVYDPYTLFRDSCGILREAFRGLPDPAPEGVHANGSFRRVNGVGVLTVWGTPHERGFAHGRLLAPAILDMLDAVCGSNLLLSDGRDYERDIVPLMDRFAFEYWFAVGGFLSPPGENDFLKLPVREWLLEQ